MHSINFEHKKYMSNITYVFWIILFYKMSISTNYKIYCMYVYKISTFSVVSAHFLKVPSTPQGPKPSMISRVSLKGIVSGVGKIFPCSNAMPRSMCITSAVILSIKIFWRCLSPSPGKNVTIKIIHWGVIRFRYWTTWGVRVLEYMISEICD